MGESEYMKKINLITLIMGLVVLSACGSKSSKTAPLTSSASNTSTTPALTTQNPVGNVGNLPAAAQQMVQLSGSNGNAFSKSYNFFTSQTLKVRVEALSAPNLLIPGYTNYVFPYGCMRVTVTVNGSTRTSKILKVAGTQASAECQNAPSVDTIDFSDITTGNGPVVVTFSNAEYDNCRYYDPRAYGCSMSAVWQNHQVRFNATVQVDGTYMQ
jgi:ABC-type Fe3+-hydroxamate transport system substrate-binding protein